jgi:hypothetical protein
MVSSPANQAGSNFGELWTAALRRYQDNAGHDLSRLSHISSVFSLLTVDEVCTVLQEREESFKAFRAHGEKIRGVLAPIVRLVRLFVEAGAEAVSFSVRPHFHVCCLCLISRRVQFLVGRQSSSLLEFCCRYVITAYHLLLTASFPTSCAVGHQGSQRCI